MLSATIGGRLPPQVHCMNLTFDQGNQSQPKGHAILYYRSGAKVLATYVAVLPLKLDLTRYVPPFMASQVKSSGIDEFSAFAMPPIPEEVESYELLDRLAGIRGDDLVYGGSVRDDFMEAAQQVNDAVQAYAQLYHGAADAVRERQGPASAPSELDVNEVMFSFLSERDKLGEMAKLVGKLQFAVGGKDTGLKEEALREMGLLAKHLPDSYNASRLLEVATWPPPWGFKLAQLYLERCYKLVDADYPSVQRLEQAIRELEAVSKGRKDSQAHRRRRNDGGSSLRLLRLRL